MRAFLVGVIGAVVLALITGFVLDAAVPSTAEVYSSEFVRL